MTPITELTVLSAPKAIWREFLESYFDGATHDVGAHTGLAFPKANVTFGQLRGKQPLNRADNTRQAADTATEIRVICFPRSERLTWNVNPDEGEHLLAFNQVMFQFQVRARREREADAEALADWAAQLLHALLVNPDTRFPLARVGVRDLAARQPEPVAAAEWSLRLVHCQATLEYPVLGGDATPSGGTITTLASGQNLLPFLREDPLVVGEYLGGYYHLGVAQRAQSVRLVATAGSTDTVLELEVNGALTGRTVTIPAGAALAEVTATADLAATLIPAAQAIRWKIVSGPAAEAAASDVSLTLKLS